MIVIALSGSIKSQNNIKHWQPVFETFLSCNTVTALFRILLNQLTTNTGLIVPVIKKYYGFEEK